MQYLNFDIYIGDRNANGYPLRVESKGHGASKGMGEQRGQLLLDTSSPDLTAQLDRLNERKTDRAFLRQLGELLYRNLFHGDIEKLLVKSLGAAQAQALGLRVRLRIDAPAVAVLPWELVYSSSEHGYLSTHIESPIVRYQEMARVIPNLSTALPLNMLVVIPDYRPPFEAVDGKRERRVIEKALEKMDSEVNVDFFTGEAVTWSGLHERLTERPDDNAYQCFHFIGHGTFQNGHGHLVLSGENGDNDIVSDARFAELFQNVPSIRLVVLNACQGATSSSSQPLAGTAAHLVSAGVPAVVAMQFSILDKAAVKFARSFYRNLFRGTDSGRVDVAISHARHVLSTSYPGEREMATPVLVTHASDGTLFLPDKDGIWSDIRRPDALKTADNQQGHALGLLQNLQKTRPDDPELGKQVHVVAEELARIRRRIAQARFGLLTALVVGALAFSLLWIRVLDLLTLDTRAEFAIMTLGDQFAEPDYSDLIQTVGLRFANRSLTENRLAVATAIRNLGHANASLIVLDLNYPTSNGEFASEPQAGARIVDAIREVGPQTRVVVGARGVKNGRLVAPDSLLEAVVATGHACVESKLGIARSLPVSIENNGVQLPSLALAAVAAYRGGEVNPVAAATIRFPDAPDAPHIVFAASERNTALQPSAVCQPVVAGATVTHRFFRLRSIDLATRSLIDVAELTAVDLTDPASMQRLREQFGDKIVVLGLADGGDVVRDNTGQRLGLLWQADAINNLLLNKHLRPMRTGMQFLLMVAVAGLGATLALTLHKRRHLSLILLILLSAAMLAGVVYTYAEHNMLLNPLYHIVALWLAWWIARKVGVRWLA